MDIRQALKTLEHNAEWVDRYVAFLANTVEPEHRGEAHHVLPKALFPEFRRFREHPWNRILLSPQDHLVAHYYLYRAVPSLRTRFALRMMVGTRTMASLEAEGYDPSLLRDVADVYAEANQGFKHTIETRLRMGVAQERRHARHRAEGFDYGGLPRGASHHRQIYGLSEEVKAKISAALTGRKQDPVTVETRRLKLVGQRKPWTPEARQARSDKMKGVVPTNGLTFAGHTHSEEFKARRSREMKTLHIQNPEHPMFTNKPRGGDHWTYGKVRDGATRAKISEAMTGKTQSEATKQKRAASLAMSKMPDYTDEEVALFERVLADPELKVKITALPKTVQTVVAGLRLMAKGEATEENRRYWRQAQAWVASR